MRIAYLSSSIVPSRAANSVHVMKMSQAFSKNGHDVILYAPDRKKRVEKNIDNVYRYYGVDNCFTIKKKPWVRIKGRGYIFGFLTALDLKKENIDLAYGRKLSSCFFAALFGYPTIYESHSPIDSSNKLQSLLFKRMIKNKNFKRLVVISKALKDYYLSNYDISDDKILVAHDGADLPEKQEESEHIQFDNNKFNVGYIGQLYPGKGMEIIAELVANCKWANFHIIGGTKSDIDLWKSKLDEYNNVTFYGYVPNGETEKYRQAFDVVLAPYQKEVSTFGGGGTNIAQWMSPLKIFEYMASGKAIVSSDLPVLREVLIDNENAMLCDPDDVSSWIDNLRLLYKNDKLRDKLGVSARKVLIDKYTWENRAEKVIRNL